MRLRIFCLLAVLFLHMGTRSLASEISDDGTHAYTLSYNIRALLFAQSLHIADSSQNPANEFLKLYRYSGELDLRPDFFAEFSDITAVAKPRFIGAYRWCENGGACQEEGFHGKALFNELRAQARVFSPLFVSFGKEKILWGPSFLATPSNILFTDIEKLNPTVEVEGKYLAKIVYLPNQAVTVTAIAETQKDENELQKTVKPLHVLKIDYLASDHMVSLIGYQRQDDRFRLGSYGQWTASDALVLYYDGIVARGSHVLYPEQEQSSVLGGEFIPKYQDSHKLFGTVTAGGAYTFLSGITCNLEFLYNGPGYSNTEAKEYHALRQNAADHFFDGGALSGLASKTLSDALYNGLAFERKYYLMAQVGSREIKKKFDVSVRYIYNLEESAGSAATIAEWRISDAINIMNVNNISVNRGKNTEFNSVSDKSFQLVIEAHF